MRYPLRSRRAPTSHNIVQLKTDLAAFYMDTHDQQIAKFVNSGLGRMMVNAGSSESGLPMCYVRGAAKDHGRGNRIEGRAEPGAKVVVIEDLILSLIHI